MDNKPLRPSSSRTGSASGVTGSSGDDGIVYKPGSNADDAGPVSSSRLSTSSTAQGSGDKNLSQLGDYLLLKKLGAGAMGAVYKARQVATKREVALKVLFQHVAENPKLVTRFHREAKVTTALKHPNIVRGFDAGEDHGFHYFAMEFVDGDSLQKWLTRVGKISLGDSLNIVLSCARALQYAHEKEIIHRDIKPDNILIARDGVAKLADLGMVKMLDEDMSLTQTGHAVGTPWYMPLEQAKNAKETDGRCDIYALGCVFYACLTGQPPFTGKTLVEVIQAKEQGTFPPARQSNQEVPERVDLILAKMVAKLPRYRYQTCAELIKDLESVGLVNEALGFLDAGKAAATAGTGGSSTPRCDPMSATMRSAFPEEPKTPVADIWYIIQEGAGGKTIRQVMTTEQVLHLIEQPTFEPGKVKASREPNQGFGSVATFKEFTRAALGRSTRSNIDRNSVRKRKLISKIVEKEYDREEVMSADATTSSYWFGIFWRCAAACLALVLLFFGGKWAIQQLSSMF